MRCVVRCREKKTLVVVYVLKSRRSLRQFKELSRKTRHRHQKHRKARFPNENDNTSTHIIHHVIVDFAFLSFPV